MSTTIHTTYAQFDEMIRRGDFADSDQRQELILGEILVMPVPDPEHEAVVDELNEWSHEVLRSGEARVRIQNTLGIPGHHSLILPDVLWVRRRDYSEQRPLPEDVLLVIEVSDTTLSKDRSKKGKLYARAGIAEYWIFNLPDRCLEIRRDPHEGTYRTIKVLHPGDEARPLAFPEVALPISRIFPA